MVAESQLASAALGMGAYDRSAGDFTPMYPGLRMDFSDPFIASFVALWGDIRFIGPNFHIILPPLR
jgi:hypothetical protein